MAYKMYCLGISRNYLFYFVRSNEMIDSTPYQQLVSFGQSAQTTLLNGATILSRTEEKLATKPSKTP